MLVHTPVGGSPGETEHVLRVRTYMLMSPFPAALVPFAWAPTLMKGRVARNVVDHARVRTWELPIGSPIWT